MDAFAHGWMRLRACWLAQLTAARLRVVVLVVLEVELAGEAAAANSMYDSLSSAHQV